MITSERSFGFEIHLLLDSDSEMDTIVVWTLHIAVDLNRFGKPQ